MSTKVNFMHWVVGGMGQTQNTRRLLFVMASFTRAMEESLRNKETSWTWVEKSEVEGSGGTEVITDDITSEVTNVKKIKG